MDLIDTFRIFHPNAEEKVKMQPSEWEKILANETTDKGLITKTYKQLIQLNTRKNKQSNTKVGKRPK